MARRGLPMSSVCMCVKQQLLKATAMLGAGKVQEKPGKVWGSRNRDARFGKHGSSRKASDGEVMP